MGLQLPSSRKMGHKNICIWRERERERERERMYRGQGIIRPVTYVLIFFKIKFQYLNIWKWVRIYLLQLKLPTETLFYRNKQYKVTALVRYFAHLCWSCSNDMLSQNVNVLIKNVVARREPDGNRLNTDIEAWIDQLEYKRQQQFCLTRGQICCPKLQVECNRSVWGSNKTAVVQYKTFVMHLHFIKIVIYHCLMKLLFHVCQVWKAGRFHYFLLLRSQYKTFVMHLHFIKIVIFHCLMKLLSFTFVKSEKLDDFITSYFNIVMKKWGDLLNQWKYIYGHWPTVRKWAMFLCSLLKETLINECLWTFSFHSNQSYTTKKQTNIKRMISIFTLKQNINVSITSNL